MCPQRTSSNGVGLDSRVFSKRSISVTWFAGRLCITRCQREEVTKASRRSTSVSAAPPAFLFDRRATATHAYLLPICSPWFALLPLSNLGSLFQRGISSWLCRTNSPGNGSSASVEGTPPAKVCRDHRGRDTTAFAERMDCVRRAGSLSRYN